MPEEGTGCRTRRPNGPQRPQIRQRERSRTARDVRHTSRHPRSRAAVTLDRCPVAARLFPLQNVPGCFSRFPLCRR